VNIKIVAITGILNQKLKKLHAQVVGEKQIMGKDRALLIIAIVVVAPGSKAEILG